MTQEHPPDGDSRTESRAVLLIYASSFSYQITLGLIQVLVPLYALHLGYDLATLGIIVASQAVFGLVLRLFAGAIADQFGERWVLWASFITMFTGMAFFVVSGAFWMLVLGQSFVGYSRATYWTATQSYVSRINPARSGEIYGRVNGAGSAGGVIGAFLSGVLITTLGYGPAFAITGGRRARRFRGQSRVAAAGGSVGAARLPRAPRAGPRHRPASGHGPRRIRRVRRLHRHDHAGRALHSIPR